MPSPFLHNYLVEYIDGKGLTNLAAEVEAPDADQARTQMLGYLRRAGVVEHRQRGKVRKAKGLGEPRLRVKMADKGTSGAKLYIPWLAQGEVVTDVRIPKLGIAQPKVKSFERPAGPEFEEEFEPMVGREFVEARIPPVAEMYSEPEAEAPEEEIDLGTDYGTPLAEKVFGRSPIMDVSRRSGGK